MEGARHASVPCQWRHGGRASRQSRSRVSTSLQHRRPCETPRAVHILCITVRVRRTGGRSPHRSPIRAYCTRRARGAGRGGGFPPAVDSRVPRRTHFWRSGPRRAFMASTPRSEHCGAAAEPVHVVLQPAEDRGLHQVGLELGADDRGARCLAPGRRAVLLRLSAQATRRSAQRAASAGRAAEGLVAVHDPQLGSTPRHHRRRPAAGQHRQPVQRVGASVLHTALLPRRRVARAETQHDA